MFLTVTSSAAVAWCVPTSKFPKAAGLCPLSVWLPQPCLQLPPLSLLLCFQLISDLQNWALLPCNPAHLSLQCSFSSLPFTINPSFLFFLSFVSSPGSTACLSSLPSFVKIILLPNWASDWISLRILLLELYALERGAKICHQSRPQNWLLLQSPEPAGICDHHSQPVFCWILAVSMASYPATSLGSKGKWVCQAEED